MTLVDQQTFVLAGAALGRRALQVTGEQSDELRVRVSDDPQAGSAVSSAQIENEINSEFRRVHGKTRILVKLAAAALAMPDEIGRKALYQVVGPPQGTRDVRRGAGSGSAQVADPVTDLGVPVGMQLGDRGVTDQPGSG